MTRYERLLKRGFKVCFVMCRTKGQEGYCIARFGNTVYRGTSESNLHYQVFGY